MVVVRQLCRIHQVVQVVEFEIVEGLVVILETLFHIFIVVEQGALGLVNQFVVVPVVGVLLRVSSFIIHPMKVAFGVLGIDFLFQARYLGGIVIFIAEYYDMSASGNAVVFMLAFPYHFFNAILPCFGNPQLFSVLVDLLEVFRLCYKQGVPNVVDVFVSHGIHSVHPVF